MLELVDGVEDDGEHVARFARSVCSPNSHRPPRTPPLSPPPPSLGASPTYAVVDGSSITPHLSHDERQSYRGARAAAHAAARRTRAPSPRSPRSPPPPLARTPHTRCSTPPAVLARAQPLDDSFHTFINPVDWYGRPATVRPRRKPPPAPLLARRPDPSSRATPSGAASCTCSIRYSARSISSFRSRAGPRSCSRRRARCYSRAFRRRPRRRCARERARKRERASSRLVRGSSTSRRARRWTRGWSGAPGGRPPSRGFFPHNPISYVDAMKKADAPPAVRLVLLDSPSWS